MLTSKLIDSNKKRNVLFRGSCIQDFIVIYGNLPGIASLVTLKDNSTHLLELFKDFLELIERMMKDDKSLQMFSNSQKEKAIIYIEKHLFLKLYSRYALILLIVSFL